MDWGVLRQNFEYDLWANSQWLHYLQAKKLPVEETHVFRHILGAQKIWADRCNGISPKALEAPEPSVAILQAIHDSWMLLLTARIEDVDIEYRRTTGEGQIRPLSQIARHAINHGTYHRGHLRGLCQAKGVLDFPETDMISYFFELDAI